MTTLSKEEFQEGVWYLLERIEDCLVSSNFTLRIPYEVALDIKEIKDLIKEFKILHGKDK